MVISQIHYLNDVKSEIIVVIQVQGKKTVLLCEYKDHMIDNKLAFVMMLNPLFIQDGVMPLYWVTAKLQGVPCTCYTILPVTMYAKLGIF